MELVEKAYEMTDQEKCLPVLAAISRHYDDLQEALRRPADMADKILDYAAFASLVGVALRGVTHKRNEMTDQAPCRHWWQHTVYGAAARERNGTTCVLCGERLSR